MCWIKRIETLQVDGDGVKGRPKKRWREVLRKDMREKGLYGNVVAAYAPQTGRSQKEKDNFWEAVWKLIEGIKKTERIMLGGDLNGHVGK